MFSLIPRGKTRENKGEMVSHYDHPMARIRDEFDSFFDRWNRWLTPFDSGNGWNRFWDCHLEDDESEFVVKAELPGFDQNELDVQISGQVLTVKAEKKHEFKDEQHCSSYHRSVTLPEEVEWEKIDAQYKNGLLTIHLPKTEQAKAKRITVKS